MDLNNQTHNSVPRRGPPDSPYSCSRLVVTTTRRRSRMHNRVGVSRPSLDGPYTSSLKSPHPSSVHDVKLRLKNISFVKRVHSSHVHNVMDYQIPILWTYMLNQQSLSRFNNIRFTTPTPHKSSPDFRTLDPNVTKSIPLKSVKRQ